MRARSLRQWLLVALCVLFAGWLVAHIWDLTRKASIAVREAREAERTYQALEERRKNLASSIAALDTPLGRDAAIRRAFGVARVGEEVIVVLSAPSASTTPQRSWWQKVGDWF